MDAQDVMRLFSELAKVPLEKRGKIDTLLSTLGKEVGAAQEERLPVGIESLTKGRPVEVGFDLKLELTAGRKASFSSAQSQKPAKGEVWLGIHGKPLSPGMVKALQRAEPVVLGWLQKDPQNAARFAADPVGALAALEKELDPALLKQLRDEQKSRKAVPAPGVRVDKVSVRVAKSGAFGKENP